MLKEWTTEEAERWFKKIEEQKGKLESFDIELKQELSWEDTSIKTNTTQRAFSGFANTYGGYLITGFNKQGEPVGILEETNIENTISNKLNSKLMPRKRDYISSLFRVKYYNYSDKKILVIFISESHIPLQCDNGVYYYREQSEFRFMPHNMLEDKFRRSFEEEKNIYLVINELKHLIDATHTIKTRDSFRIDFFLQNFIKSADTLYYFYKRHNLSQIIEQQMIPIRFLISANYPIGEHNSIFSDARDLLKALEKIIEIEKETGVILK